VISSDQTVQSLNFTTIESPVDWNHPVSDTRKFGDTQNGDGSYTLFTRGVDRIAESTDEFIGNYTPAPNAFEGADALWNTFKDNVYGFVKDHGGNAQQPHTSDNSIWRPNWDEVDDIMTGTDSRTVSDLECK